MQILEQMEERRNQMIRTGFCRAERLSKPGAVG
jgi:hypothetical protein